jgi:hypothetical protein
MWNWARTHEKLKIVVLKKWKMLTFELSNDMSFITNIRHFFEKHGFEVSSRLADRLGMRASSVRLFFIYISFFTVGLWFGVYLTLAFLVRLKDLVYTKRSSVFDL